jgi:hypothetical protein
MLFHRKIRTKQESFSNVPWTILFCALWYTSLLKGAQQSGLSNGIVIGLVAGLLPVWHVVSRTGSVLHYRRLHKQLMETPPTPGRIIGCEKRSWRERSGRHSYLVTEYVLTISSQFGQFRTEPYDYPVYRLLSSPEVDVYTDESGWHHVIDGFHYKEHRNDPSPFTETLFSDSPWQEAWSRLSQPLALLLIAVAFLYVLFH